ncbi:DUF1254 domain-containing protein [Pseudoxanthomonas sp. UTMC 1351]|uniref:DUF1254 domain-containing protein n=1 Tax=Pseudoxanthomonas sp. UTMC 1351 TaxID=2695853 RepID=UPI0034CE5F2E
MHDFAVDSKSSQFKAPFNQIKNLARVATPEDTTVITPNSDTPYSILWLDLRAEPAVISVPVVDKSRYYSVQLIDGNLYNFGYIGSRATGNNAGNYLVVGPDWKGEKPVGINQVFTSTTPFVFANFRTQLFDPGDIENVKKVQAGYSTKPLSAFLNQPAPAPAPKIDFRPATTDGIKENFFDYLSVALEFVPPTPEDQEIRAKLASIGVGPGKTFKFDDLSFEHKAAARLGMKEGDAKVDRFIASGLKDVNGWKIGSFFGDRAFYKGHWLTRAAAAKAGIYGNNAAEATYPFTRTTARGETVDTSKRYYTLTFPPGQLPPVNSFWSVTMYDGNSQLLIKNPIDRYLINSPMLANMTKNPDGSLTLHIQKDSPGKGKEANWLPAPDGPAYLVMRLYWPKDTGSSILPAGEGTWKPPGLVATN